MPEPLLWQGLVLIGVGTLAGGITSSVNVWLLFHPKSPSRLGPFTLQGAIPKYQARIAQSVERWVTEGLASQALEAGARHFIASRRDALLHDERPLLERLPRGLLAAVEQGITDYLPLAVEQLGSTLEDPEARTRITEALRGVLDQAVANLKAHERIVARLVVTPDRLDRMVSELGLVFESPAFKARLSQTVNDAVMRFLRTPIAERLWTLGPDRLDGLERAASDYVVAALKSPETADWASARAREVVEALRDYPIGMPRSLTRGVGLGFGLGALIGALSWGLFLSLR